MRKRLALALAVASLLDGCTPDVVEPARPRVTASASAEPRPPVVDGSRWFRLPQESGVSAALADGSRWLLVGGRRALAKRDGSTLFAASDPNGLRQLVFLNDGTEAFYGLAGDSLVRFADPLGKWEARVSDARLPGARAHAFASRILVRPARGEPFLLAADGKGEMPLSSALPFEASAVAFGSATVGFAMTDAFGLLKTADGARSWSRAPPLLEGELATRQGVPVERVRASGKTAALSGFALGPLENKTAELCDVRSRDPLALAAASGFPLANGDLAVIDAAVEPGATVVATVLRLSGATGEVLARKPLGSYPLKPFAPGVGEPRCNIAQAARARLLVECDGRQLFELDEFLELVGARTFETKLRLSEMGSALSEGDCTATNLSGFACVRNADGSFETTAFERNPASSATLLLPKTDGALVIVDYESQGFSVREVARSGATSPIAKFGSRVKAAKIHGDIDREGALTLVVEGTLQKPGALPQVEVSTVVQGRVKTDSFPGAITARNVGGRVVLRGPSEIIARDAVGKPWQRFARSAPARGEVRVSRAGFIAGDDVRLGWPLIGSPAPDGATAASAPPRELVCRVERNMRSLPRLDNSAIDSAVPAWTRALAGRVAIAREASRYRVRYFTRTPITTIEELFVPARSLAPLTVIGAAIRGADLALLVNADKASYAIRSVNGVASIEAITAPLSSQVEPIIGADGSVAWDRGRPSARQIVLWPKASSPRDVLTTDRNGFRFEPFEKGIDVRAIGQSVTGVARYSLSETTAPLVIEPARFKAEGSLAIERLTTAPACRTSGSREARLLDLEKAFSAVVIDGERLPTSSFDVGFSMAGDSPCASLALAVTERSRWQISADLATGAAVITKTEYQRLPASCVLEAAEKSPP